jgi:predicted nucleic acid-binding protein
VIAPDTSVLIAALAPWHPLHARAREELRRAPIRLVGHAAFETVSVLSRMPEGTRVASTVVLEALERTSPDPWLSLSAAGLRACMRRAVDAGLQGGALYDALVATTAAERGATLLSADLRAQAAYEAMGASMSFIGP